MFRIRLSDKTTLLRVGACAAFGVGALLPASAAGPLTFDSESLPGGSVMVGQNSGAAGNGVLGKASPNGGNGIAGVAEGTSQTGGAGVRGFANEPASYGLFGSGSSPDATRPSIGVYGMSTGSYGMYAATQSATVPAILGYNFTGTTGAGVEGYGSGNGVVGISADANGTVGRIFWKSGVSGQGFAGVYGADESVDSGVGNSGVYGVTTTGYGVSGKAKNGGTAVAGFSTGGVGVYGTSSSQLGVYGSSPNSIAIEGNSAGSTGVVAETEATPDPTDPSGVNGPPALLVSTDSGSPAIKVSSASGDVMSLDANGNMIVGGNVTIDGNLSVAGTTGACATCPSPLVRPQKTATRVSVGTYEPEQTVRTIEDVGEAQLVDGKAYVRLDEAFGAASDAHSNYLVFITPQGETQGLYVTEKTRAGFSVREIGNGRSSLAFDYRISAKPYGSTEKRLPILTETEASGLANRPLHTSSSMLRFVRSPLKHALAAPSGGSGLIPKVSAPSPSTANPR
jgi:hypothetical protein